MKVIKEGKVYDLDYGMYDTVVAFPGEPERNAVGLYESVRRELRRDKATGRFYKIRYTDTWNRRDVEIIPLARADAAILAEDWLDYDDWAKFFEPETGERKELERKAQKLQREVESLEARVRELSAEKELLS